MFLRRFWQTLLHLACKKTRHVVWTLRAYQVTVLSQTMSRRKENLQLGCMLPETTRVSGGCVKHGNSWGMGSIVMVEVETVDAVLACFPRLQLNI
mmetsp:Transcript_29742/g.79011  ORF Transcript_29742/g.79011 Transcript_29742/m.79011 type:complete len:95 (-) Transcript_29742:573-857(-)